MREQARFSMCISIEMENQVSSGVTPPMAIRLISGALSWML